MISGCFPLAVFKSAGNNLQGFKDFHLNLRPDSGLRLLFSAKFNRERISEVFSEVTPSLSQSDSRAFSLTLLAHQAIHGGHVAFDPYRGTSPIRNRPPP